MLPERNESDAASDVPSEGLSPAQSANGPEAPSEADAVFAAKASTTSAPVAETVTAEPAATETLIEAPAADEAIVAQAPEVPPAVVHSVEDDPHHWDGPSIPFVPHHALVEGMMALSFLTVILALVATVPADLEARANPFLSPAGVMPEWYLVAPFELLHLVPALPGMTAVGVAMIVLVVWPFIDRRPRRLSRRPAMIAFAGGVIAILVGLTVYSYMHAAG